MQQKPSNKPALEESLHRQNATRASSFYAPHRRVATYLIDQFVVEVGHLEILQAPDGLVHVPRAQILLEQHLNLCNEHREPILRERHYRIWCH